MKILKFRDYLIKQILDGSKTVTWRLFDEKNIQIGDLIQIQNWNTGEEIVKAEVTQVLERKLGELGPADFEGHEKYASKEEMYRHYRDYYGDKVDKDTVVKIIRFKLLN